MALEAGPQVQSAGLGPPSSSRSCAALLWPSGIRTTFHNTQAHPTGVCREAVLRVSSNSPVLHFPASSAVWAAHNPTMVSWRKLMLFWGEDIVTKPLSLTSFLGGPVSEVV